MRAYLGVGGCGVAAAAGFGVFWLLGAGVASASPVDSPDPPAANRDAATAQRSAPAARRVAAAVPTNQPPVISTVSVRTPNASTGALSGTVTASDPERGSLAYSASASALGRVAINAGGVFTYTPTSAARHAAAKEGAGPSATSDTVTVTVTDVGGAYASANVTVPITARNTVPRFTRTTVGAPDAVTGVVSGRVSATDADKDPLSFSAPASTAKGTITMDALSGVFSYTPTADARNVAAQTGLPADKLDMFIATVSDGYGGQTSVRIKVAIGPALRLPEPQYLPVTAQLRVGAEVIGLEVASTREQQSRGLMARPPLAADRGMLFTYAQPQAPLFWMWQTPSALDMVFLLAGEVKTVYAGVQPCLSQPCQYYGPLFQPVDAVVELRSGRAGELGLAPGVRVVIEPFAAGLSPQAAATV